MAKNRYILLIEDSRSQALQLQLWLQRTTGRDVRVSVNGVEGWKQACNDVPSIVLLDINLPMLDGFQILGRLKRNQATARVPVVILTTSQAVGDVEQALSLGADAYMFKDDFFRSQQASDQLLDTIKKFLYDENEMP